MHRILIPLLILTTTLRVSYAAENDPDAVDEVKAHDKSALYGSLFGDPGLNVLGINFAFFSSPNLRWNAGVGTVILGTTLGAGFNYYLTDRPSNRPYVGAGANILFYESIDGNSLFDDELRTTRKSILYPSFKVGFEFGGQNGVFVDVHMNAFVFLGNDVGQHFFFDPLPSLALGLYF